MSRQQSLYHTILHALVLQILFLFWSVSSWTLSNSVEGASKNTNWMMEQWIPLTSATITSPVISSYVDRRGSRQFAKDIQYLTAVHDAWKQDEESAGWSRRVEMRPIVYHSSDPNSNCSKGTKTPLFGHAIRPTPDDVDISSSSPSSSRTKKLPGRVLLFHTAAGPHDVFLLWKGSYLASNLGCTVLICDVLGDENGWGWDPDRTRYNEMRRNLLRDDGQILRARVRAAIDTLTNLHHGGDGGDGDSTSDDSPSSTQIPLACVGWCLGAQPIMELSRIEDDQQRSNVVALATFHGVFHRQNMDSIARGSASAQTQNSKIHCPKMIICNGADDPFVSPNDLESIEKIFQQAGYDVNIKQYPNSKHGFTNPAQAFNPSQAFAYNEVAANDSWNEAVELLREQFAKNDCN